MTQKNQDIVSKKEFEALSEFRHQMCRFERFSENAARLLGITTRQYLLLLHIKGYPGRSFATVPELAVRLQVEPDELTALVVHCEANGLIQSLSDGSDGQPARLQLLENGDRILMQLATSHRAELRWLNGIFPIPLINF